MLPGRVLSRRRCVCVCVGISYINSGVGSVGFSLVRPGSASLVTVVVVSRLVVFVCVWLSHEAFQPFWGDSPFWVGFGISIVLFYSRETRKVGLRYICICAVCPSCSGDFGSFGCVFACAAAATATAFRRFSVAICVSAISRSWLSCTWVETWRSAVGGWSYRTCLWPGWMSCLAIRWW